MEGTRRPDLGRQLVTNAANNYVSVLLNAHGFIEEIVYLGDFPLHYEALNLICLIGTHEKCLNSLVSRFDEGLIQDFLAFVRSWWSMALFHDRWKQFFQELRKFFVAQPDTQQIIQQLQKHSKQSEDSKRKLLSSFATKINAASQEVNMKLLEFLQDNKPELAMYLSALPKIE